MRRLIAVLVAPIALILAVLGSILGGIATPTEAASVGAVGAMLLAAPSAGAEGLLIPVMMRPTQITSMIFHDPDRCDYIQPGVSRSRRRHHGRAHTHQSAGRRRPARRWR